MRSTNRFTHGRSQRECLVAESDEDKPGTMLDYDDASGRLVLGELQEVVYCMALATSSDASGVDNRTALSVHPRVKGL